MDLLDSIMTGIEGGPRKIVVHGTPAIGKSTFASMSPKPIFIQTEDGLRDLNVSKFPLATDFGMAMQAAWELANKDHNFETVVVDSIDWMERLIFDQVVREEDKSSVKSIADIGFGKGPERAVAYLQSFLKLLDDCSYKGMHVILIAHTDVQRFEPPDNQGYDRYTPRLHKKAWPVVVEWASEVLFATYKIFTKTEEGGFGKKSTKGISDGERVLKTTERPSHVAKNRLGLPDEMPLDWSAFAAYLNGKVDTNGITH